jgi:ABC-type sugar transport system ATPase subunit
MTVRENIGFVLKLRKLPKDELTAKVNEATEILGLTDWLDRKPGQLSGGQRQRVAMGRAVIRQPSVFLMDEPFSNLDATLRVQMRVEVARIQRHLGVSAIYVAHDQVEAMTMGDRVAVLRDGSLQQVDTPQTLYDSPDNLFMAPLADRHLAILAGAFRKLDTVAVLTARLLPAPQGNGDLPAPGDLHEHRDDHPRRHYPGLHRRARM